MTVMNVLSPTQATQTPTQASMPALVRDVAGQPNQDKRKRLAALLRQRMSGLPLSHGQRAMWFIHQLAPSCVAYNEVFAWHIRTAVKEGILQQALRALQMQHATLRTAYVMHEGKPIANILAEAPFDFEVVESVDWSEVQLEEAMVRVSHQPFCLERGEIIRARLFRRPNAESVLLIVAHHIAIDFWSVHLLAQDLKAFYASLCNGQGVALRPTEARYDEFVAWQTEYLQANEVRLWAYWQRNLGGTLPTLNLPNDKPRPMVQQFAGASHVLRVPEQIYQGLRNLAKAEATTLYTLVLSAYALSLLRQGNRLAGKSAAGLRSRCARGGSG